MIDILSSREIASAIWFIVILIFIFLNPTIRASAFKVIQAATAKQIVIPFIIIILYSMILVILASKFSFWEWKYLKDIAFWVTITGVPVCFGAITNNDNNDFFISILKNNLKFIVIVEFLLSSFTFNIFVELLLLPFLTLLFLLHAVADTKEEYYKVKKLLSFILSFVGFAVLGLTIKIAVATYVTLNSVDLLITFFIPIVLSALFIPIAYGYAVLAKYQELFIMMSFKEPKDKRIRRMHRWEIMKVCKLSYKRVTYFREVCLKEMYVNMSQEEFYKIIEKFKQARFNG
ncbi:Uncharacterised protein [Niallia circulans]|uniref:hypothetical protein n=1 Tax=Niallia circulans TaxID=1397 RepID=UPI00077C0EB2|nr:hypothetical protein [Niallia circulans]MDR4316656.1 hypothetical protein [Niallia circulans]MED3840351.1 hypothetical protein [Niallia circulans]MED4242039.1 hypothetical protein [Niallia circulans]MED4249528.1 hypothetical protein [Niallia circulans]QKH59255.1 hypothetical protein FOC77_00290 [Niallia circulans]